MRLLLLALFLLPRLAVANEEASLEAQARGHFESGNKAFVVEDFPRAIAEFKLAYNIKADSAFLFNIAQSYRLKSRGEAPAEVALDLEQAILFYRNYLRELPGKKSFDARRKEVEGRVAELEQQQARVKTADPIVVVAAPGVVVEPPRRTRLWIGLGAGAAALVVAAVVIGVVFGLATDWSATGRAECTGGGCILVDASRGLR